ncbi:putative ABC transporter ATP-binding protein YjjK [Salinivirga cyanobacteriivorans]|uniref:Putative ABC transporter ATP-binding protein YjjK n=1 Tax=Salinivirga cyanobacteriivorans TaxID=1307839 RepID=A0A0S2I2R2_9BACT|nr:ABC-F family ATP-binding cassette domain-containing protein [Salinivirga cyanobacteriivorans]ALO16630.1 putative ABC transporter ATP-binding protein YjjK [Salinivirga cyanobacteriivorans]
MSFIQVENVGKSFGERTLFKTISFSLEKGDKTALIAKNGTGKTTLLRMTAGLETCDTGQVVMEKNIRVSFLPQEPVFKANHTLLDAVLEQCSKNKQVIKDYEEALITGDENAINKAIAQMDANEAWDMETRLRQILGNLGLENFNQPVKQLSGGERKRLSIAAAFIDSPDFLILDEPTNHLDLKSIEWLEQHLMTANTTMLMVTHDRYFLDSVCNRILELDQEGIHAYSGNFDYFLEKRKERYETMAQQTQKAQSKLKTEIEWANRMPKARGTKAKFRLDGVDKLKTEARQTKEDDLKIQSASRRQGKKVINLHNIHKSFDEKQLINDFSYDFQRQEKVGIVGENGTGKTTLLNIIAGDLTPDIGELDYGETIKIAYYRQEGMQFDEQKRVIDIAREVAEVVYLGNGQTLAVERFLNQFLFPNEMHYQRVHKLSGGEKRRLYLLTVLMTNPNFLMLDEPTNDLDIMTLGVLEEYLESFTGSVLVVSHDRYFMDRIVDHLFVFDQKGDIKDFPGNYSQLRENQESQKKKDSEKVKKSKQKKSESIKKEKQKLSYKEQKELEQLDKDIADLSEQKATLEKALESPEADPDKITKNSRLYELVNDELETKELRWLELSDLQEQLAQKSKK